MSDGNIKVVSLMQEMVGAVLASMCLQFQFDGRARRACAITIQTSPMVRAGAVSQARQQRATPGRDRARQSEN